MPKILIKRGDWENADRPALECGEPAYCYRNGQNRLLIGSNASGTSEGDSVTVKGSDYASKIGTKDSQSPIGSAIKPVYVASDGTITQSDASVGTDETTSDPTDSTKGLKPIVMANGTFVAATESHGTDDQPVYVDDGKIIPGQKYGGGTKVTINGVGKGASTATIYAPETAGVRENQISVWNASTGKSEWASSSWGNDYTPIFIYRGALYAFSVTHGGTDTPVYFNNGSISECAKYGGGTKVTLNGTDKGHKTATIYAPETAGNTDDRIALWSTTDGKPMWKASSIGASTQPVYINSYGKVVPGSLYAGGTEVTLNGTTYGSTGASFYAPTAKPSTADSRVFGGTSSAVDWQDPLGSGYAYKVENWEGSSDISHLTPGIYHIVLNRSNTYFHTVTLVFPGGLSNGKKIESSPWIELEGSDRRVWVEGTVVNVGATYEATITLRGTYSCDWFRCYKVANL